MTEEDRTLEKLVSLVRRGRGACPEPHMLVEYHRGGLPPEEAARVREHVEVCGICQASLKLISDMQAARQGEAVGEAPDWNTVEGRLRERVLAFAAPRGKARNPFERIAAGVKGVLWQPAVAYVLAIALLYPAYRGIFLIEQAREPEGEQVVQATRAGTTRTVILEPSDLRGAQTKPNEVQLVAQDRFITFQFFVPIRVAPYIQYSAHIEGATGSVARVNNMASTDGMGNFSLVFPQELFNLGSYVLVVEEFDREKGGRTETFSFPFEVVE